MYSIVTTDFTNQISNASLESLASADTKNRIKTVSEVFVDYQVLDPDLFVTKAPTLIGSCGSPRHRGGRRRLQGLRAPVP